MVTVREFTELLWPNGHDHFCNTILTMMRQLDELKDVIEMMILDSYGLGEKSDSIVDAATGNEVQCTSIRGGGRAHCSH
ncbi:putative 2-oxoglutarate-dependent dioxygenase AOP1 [Prunus yedoensis var. nudiflora]|uniref:Putative 2-oxoglutarate-dependent dioxygenase AOP1 n=1 Tax=Prunus yedoensis var. nudiflora TaxID=2094558 RepID=A0A314UHY0_PRUYE|nr:putative 2-oxoglutarate-dependent dioxygenase AOP1 [Prunus yedoensis var. nudiflora]